MSQSRTQSGVGAPSPAIAPPAVRTRSVLGAPVSVIDYQGTMDVMDELVATRERGALRGPVTR